MIIQLNRKKQVAIGLIALMLVVVGMAAGHYGPKIVGLEEECYLCLSESDWQEIMGVIVWYDSNLAACYSYLLQLGEQPPQSESF